MSLLQFSLHRYYQTKCKKESSFFSMYVFILSLDETIPDFSFQMITPNENLRSSSYFSISEYIVFLYLFFLVIVIQISINQHDILLPLNLIWIISSFYVLAAFFLLCRRIRYRISRTTRRMISSRMPRQMKK